MKTSIIICTYNEENTIEQVVKSCCEFNKYAEIIVVDDGSTDNTRNILGNLQKKYNFKYERLKENKGKSWAMVHGVELSTNEIILFFDADLINIKKEHFDALLTPIFTNEADMVLGQPSETLINYKINPFKSLTGERALLKKDIIPILGDIRELKFGVETFINLYYQAKGMRVKYVLLEGLKHPTKFEKTSTIKATQGFFKEGKEIMFTLLTNMNLLTKRIELHFDKTNSAVVEKVNKMQNDVNRRFKKLRNIFDEYMKS